MTAVRSRSAPAHRTSRGPVRESPGALRHDLEGLRAVAVLGVVVYHLRPSWLPGGFVGVDVFFVLSGFFITGLLLRESDRSSSVDLLGFWARRARRLLPASAVVIIATVLAGLVFVNSLDAHRFAVDGVFAGLFSVNWRYAALGTSYTADPAPSPLTHYWSLGVEEQFYLVWPVVLLLLAVVIGRRCGRGGLRRAVGAVAVAIGVSSFLLAWQLTPGDQPYAYFATYSRAWQLALGAGLAAGAGPLARLPFVACTLARWAGLAAILGFYALAPLDIVYPGWFALVPALGAAAIIGAGIPRSASVSGDPVRRALCSGIGQRLGRYSYGWYLWHWPPLILLPLAIGHPLTARELIACAALSLLAAVLSFHVLEHPVRSSCALAAHRGRLSLVLGAALLALVIGAAQTTSTLATWRTAHLRIASSRGAELRRSRASPRPSGHSH